MLVLYRPLSVNRSIIEEGATHVRVRPALVPVDEHDGLLQLCVALEGVVRVVRHDGPHVAVIGKLAQRPHRVQLHGQPVVLHLDEVVVPELSPEPVDDPPRLVDVVVLYRHGQLAEHARGAYDKPVTVLVEEPVIDAGLVIEAGGVRFRREPAQVVVSRLVLRKQDEMVAALLVPWLAYEVSRVHRVVLALGPAPAYATAVCLHAHDGLHVVLVARLLERDESRHPAVVGECHRRHPKLCRPLREVVGRGDTVTYGVRAVRMQRNVRTVAVVYHYWL